MAILNRFPMPGQQQFSYPNNVQFPLPAPSSPKNSISDYFTQQQLMEISLRNSMPAETYPVPAGQGDLSRMEENLSEEAASERAERLNEAALQPYNHSNKADLSPEELMAALNNLEAILPLEKEFADLGIARDDQTDILRRAMMSGKYGPPKQNLDAFVQGLTQQQRLDILKDSRNPLQYSYDNIAKHFQNYERNYEPVRAIESEIESTKQLQYFSERKAEFDALPESTKEALWKAAELRSELDYKLHRTPLFLKSSPIVNSTVQAISGTPQEWMECMKAENKAKNLPGYSQNIYEYVKLLVNIETAEKQKEKDEKFAEAMPRLSTIKSIVEKPSAAVDSLFGTGRTWAHNKVNGDNMPADLNDAYHANSQGVKVTRETVADQIRQDTGVDLLGDVYTIGVSITDALAVAPLSAVSPAIPAAILGAEAAADTAEDIVRRGGSADQAMLGGMISFAANTAFNMFSFGQLKVLAQTSVSGFRDIIYNILKSAFVNASEDTLSRAVDMIADEMVMGDLSRYNQAVKGYMQNGLSREAAEKQAGWDAARELTSTAVRGGIRGMAFAAGGMAFNAGRQRLGSSTDSLYVGNRRNDAQVNDMAARAANGQIAGPGASKASVETDYTKEDFRTAQLLNQDAPRSPFTMESQSGIITKKVDGVEFTRGKSRAPKIGKTYSFYEQVDDKGTVISRSKYGRDGQVEYRDDLVGRPHFDKKTGQYLKRHRHTYSYNEKGQPIGETITPITEEDNHE